MRFVSCPWWLPRCGRCGGRCGVRNMGLQSINLPFYSLISLLNLSTIAAEGGACIDGIVHEDLCPERIFPELTTFLDKVVGNNKGAILTSTEWTRFGNDT